MSITQTIADASGLPIVHGGPHRIVETSSMDGMFFVHRPTNAGHWCVIGNTGLRDPLKAMGNEPPATVLPAENPPEQDAPSGCSGRRPKK